VTLRRGEELRGCVGTVVARSLLPAAVAEAARNASTADLRFDPVKPVEVDGLSIEVSILSPFRIVENPDEIRVGTDGLMVEREGARGLLLPQVAAERDWDAKTFLAHTCQKAGLDPDAWCDPKSIIYRFTAEVIRE